MAALRKCPEDVALPSKMQLQATPRSLYIGAGYTRYHFLRQPAAVKLAENIEAALEKSLRAMPDKDFHPFSVSSPFYGHELHVVCHCWRHDPSVPWLCQVFDGAGDLYLEVSL